jgi:hypothetical protein
MILAPEIMFMKFPLLSKNSNGSDIVVFSSSNVFEMIQQLRQQSFKHGQPHQQKQVAVSHGQIKNDRTSLTQRLTLVINPTTQAAATSRLPCLRPIREYVVNPRPAWVIVKLSQR